MPVSDKNDIAVHVEGLGKRFNLQARQTSIGEALQNNLRRLRSHLRNLGSSSGNKAGGTAEEFWALKDISFELRHGEVLGIIGQNGAGKSTLLKILAQVLTPTTGRAELRGRVGALLEVGTGFNPELSGRENIFLYGSILGMSRADIAQRFDEIVEFAEIGQFLDQPIKHYSSGMHSRLGFSVAAHLECDILLVDEVLAVGDAAFRAKCLGKMQDVTGKGRAVIFVSHNMSAIRNMCSSALVLSKGQIAFMGSATEASEYYLTSVTAAAEENAPNPAPFVPDAHKEIGISEVFIKDSQGNFKSNIEYIEDFTIGMKVVIREASKTYYNAIWLQDMSGNVIVFSTDEDLGEALIAGKPPGVYEFSVTFPKRLFKPGTYCVMWATCRQRKGQVDRRDNAIPLVISDTHTWRAQRDLFRRTAAVAPELEWTVSRILEDANEPPQQTYLSESAT